MAQVQETIILRGHIIDSLILAKVLDLILTMGGSFDLEHVEIGRTREDQSRVFFPLAARSAGRFAQSGRRYRVAAAASAGCFARRPLRWPSSHGRRRAPPGTKVAPSETIAMSAWSSVSEATTCSTRRATINRPMFHPARSSAVLLSRRTPCSLPLTAAERWLPS